VQASSKFVMHKLFATKVKPQKPQNWQLWGASTKTTFMKKQFFLLFTLLFSINFIHAQTAQKRRVGAYKWTSRILMARCTITGELEKDSAGKDILQLSIAGQKFNVIDDNTVKGFVIIKILDYTISIRDSNGGRVITPTPNFFVFNYKREPEQYNKYKGLAPSKATARDYTNDQIYFLVSTDNLDTYAANDERVSWALSIGVLNFPFKYRIQRNNADFSGAFNFGAGIGFKLPHPVWQKFTYSILSGYSISNVALDSSSINITSNLDKLKSTNNFTAFSFSLGLLVEYEKVQAGFFIGWDRISKINDGTFGWKYQGKPWVSVGFGYSIFSNEKPKSPSGTTSESQ